MLEDDYNYLKRIEEYAKRKWQEPLLCTYLWDKYGLETNLVNRQHLLCRCDVDYAYDDDYNLRILNTFNTTSPFVNQTLHISSIAYNSYSEIEDGQLILYIKYDGDTEYRLYGDTPVSMTINEKVDFNVITKYFPSDVGEIPTIITPSEEVNISEITHIHVRDYTDADYFVSCDGDDNNPGTLTEPFKTLQHASNVISSGDTICILTPLDLSVSVLFYTDCNLICKEQNTIVNSGSVQFLTIFTDTSVYLQDVCFNKDNTTIYNYIGGDYVFNHGSGLVTIESSDVKPHPLHNISISSDDLYWISGETVSIRIKGVLQGKTAYVFNSLNELIGIITEDTVLQYKVPYGLEYDIISVVVLEDEYLVSKEFTVYNISADWYVDTVNGDDNNTGLSLHDAFKTLKTGVNHVTDVLNHIFFIGDEFVDNMNLPLNTYIRGLRNNSILKCGSDVYFNVDESLMLSDLFLETNLIDNTLFDNQRASLPLKVLHCGDKHGNIIYVDGLNGDDNNTGDSWRNALKTLLYAFSLEGISIIYFSGENTINTPYNIHETVELIGTMNTNQIYSTNNSYFNIDREQVLKLSNIALKYGDELQVIKNNTYTNNGTATMEIICSNIIPPKTNYELELISNDEWINGETVNITLELKSGTFPSNRTINIYNSQDVLITTLSELGTFQYKVPNGLTEDTIIAKVVEDTYTCSKTFKINKPTSTEWYVDTVNGNDNNTGKSLKDAFKTLEHAITQVTIEENTIYMIGTETITNITVSKDMMIDGLEYEGILTSNNSYFNIEKGYSLTLKDIVLETQKIRNNTYINNSNAKMEVII